MTTRRDKNSTIDNIGFFSPSDAKEAAVSWFSSLTKCQRRLLTVSEITLLKTVTFHRVSGFNIIVFCTHLQLFFSSGLLGAIIKLLVISKRDPGNKRFNHVLYNVNAPFTPKFLYFTLSQYGLPYHIKEMNFPLVIS